MMFINVKVVRYLNYFILVGRALQYSTQRIKPLSILCLCQLKAYFTIIVILGLHFVHFGGFFVAVNGLCLGKLLFRMI